MRLITPILCSSLFLAACAETPPVTTTYYPAKSSVRIQVLRTVACDKAGYPVLASTPTVTMTHSADFSSPRQLSLAKIDGPFANTTIKLEFYGDRRLKSVNAESKGLEETILKSAISVASTAIGRSRNIFAAECKKLKEHFGDEALTLIYVADDPLDVLERAVPIPADMQSAHYAAMFPTLLGDVCYRAGAAPAVPQPVTLDRSGAHALLKMRQPAYVPLSIFVGPVGSCESSIWSGIVAVGQKGTNYEIPIPKAAAFGSQTFAATFDEAGGILTLGYGTERGEGSALETLKAGLGEVIQTRAERTADLAADANLIAAQQRLVKCRANPEAC